MSTKTNKTGIWIIPALLVITALSGCVDSGVTNSLDAPPTRAANVRSIDSGGQHSCAIRNNGSLWCWGRNYYGQTGSGDTLNHFTPIAVGTARDWRQIDSGQFHSCAIRNNGTLWCWGNNNAGQLGTDPAANQTLQLTPRRVGGNADWQSVATGAAHTCAIRNNTLWCWGDNDFGQLGDGSFSDSVTPTQINPDTDWAAISAGASHTCGLKLDASLWCWGDNSQGQSGIDPTIVREQSAPNQVDAALNWQRLATGDNNTCATKTDGTLWCWGDNGFGQLGDGGFSDSFSPVQTGSDSDWATPTLGSRHACANKTDASLWCWGDNRLGQLSGGDTSPRPAPIQIGGDTDWGTPTSASNYTCAAKDDATVWCWGFYDNGRSPDDTALQTTPITVGGDSDWQSIATGDGHTCSIKTDGALWCWGRNHEGQLGGGGQLFEAAPLFIDAGPWTHVANGNDHSCAIRDTGTLWCWGDNLNGQLGLGTQTAHTTPQQVGAINTWARVTAGAAYSCATRTDNTLWCWGRNLEHQLGFDSPLDSVLTPTQIGATFSWSTAAAGEAHTCALDTADTLWCWGRNFNGQAAIDPAAAPSVDAPTQVSAPNLWRAIGAGGNHSCAIRTDGTLWCWGANGFGELGADIDQTDPDGSQQTPRQVSADSDWASLALGYSHSCATKLNNTLWCWGGNWHGQVGNGIADTSRQTSPDRIASATPWTRIATGYDHSCAIAAGNTLACWGSNDSGQLGTGRAWTSRPEEVLFP